MVKKAKKKISGGLFHLQDENCEAVILSSLRVFVTNEGEGWFAQGLELDYAASGDSLENVKENFENGLIDTIHEYLKIYGSLEKFIKTAPQEAWEPLLKMLNKPKQYHLSMQVVFFPEDAQDQQAVEMDDGFPFKQIAYIESQTAAAL